MNAEQAEQFHEANQLLSDASESVFNYWVSYSNMSTWQFWVLLALLIAPLIVLWYAIDRGKALLIGFFGFNVHVWFHYCDLYTTMHGLTNFPYKVMPFYPVSVTLDTSLVPVIYMLLYQWAVNRKKNYYGYSVLLSAFFSFALKPLLAAVDLFWMHESLNYYLLFILYVMIAWVSKWITDLFIYAQSSARASRRGSRG